MTRRMNYKTAAQEALELVDTNSLIAELIRRFDHAAFLGCKDNYPPGHSQLTESWEGDPDTIAALSMLLAFSISPSARRMIQ